VVRILRFSKSVFYRIQPDSKSVRDTKPYTAVESIRLASTVTDDERAPPELRVTQMIMHYNDGVSKDDYFKAPYTACCRMCEIIRSNHAEAVVTDMNTL
jgi:hypothetical protein